MKVFLLLLIATVLTLGCLQSDPSSQRLQPCIGAVGDLFDAQSPDTVLVQLGDNKREAVLIYAVDAPWQSHRPKQLANCAACINAEWVVCPMALSYQALCGYI